MLVEQCPPRPGLEAFLRWCRAGRGRWRAGSRRPAPPGASSLRPSPSALRRRGPASPVVVGSLVVRTLVVGSLRRPEPRRRRARPARRGSRPARRPSPCSRSMAAPGEADRVGERSAVGARSGCAQSASRPASPARRSAPPRPPPPRAAGAAGAPGPTSEAKVCSAGPPAARRRRTVSRSACACGSRAAAASTTSSIQPSTSASAVSSRSRAARCAGVVCGSNRPDESASCSASGSLGSTVRTASSSASVSIRDAAGVLLDRAQQVGAQPRHAREQPGVGRLAQRQVQADLVAVEARGPAPNAATLTAAGPRGRPAAAAARCRRRRRPHRRGRRAPAPAGRRRTPRPSGAPSAAPRRASRASPRAPGRPSPRTSPRSHGPAMGSTMPFQTGRVCSTHPPGSTPRCGPWPTAGRVTRSSHRSAVRSASATWRDARRLTDGRGPPPCAATARATSCAAPS